VARELTRKVYRLTKKPEFARDYGLKRQIQDAAVRGFINYLKKYEERKSKIPDFERGRPTVHHEP